MIKDTIHKKQTKVFASKLFGQKIAVRCANEKDAITLIKFLNSRSMYRSNRGVSGADVFFTNFTEKNELPCYYLDDSTSEFLDWKVSSAENLQKRNYAIVDFYKIIF